MRPKAGQGPIQAVLKALLSAVQTTFHPAVRVGVVAASLVDLTASLVGSTLHREVCREGTVAANPACSTQAARVTVAETAP